ncbi:MAG TPA: DUF1232 domain-containing protein [Thermoanaerobaculia bacterium]|nr:DUF1232 domain-containing protein [Thermoanaerobaculia bacterium]
MAERTDESGKSGTDELSAAVAEDLASFDLDAAEAEAEAALTKGTDLPSKGLLSFYDTLREKVLHTIEKRGGKLPGDAVRMLLLVPDVFILLVRLTLDKTVPGSTRAMIGGALAYFILPFDLLPEAILGPVGYLDDLVLAAAVLSQAFGGELEPYARKHWSGDEDLRIVLRDITQTAHKLLGHKLYERLKLLLGRRGIEIKD